MLYKKISKIIICKNNELLVSLIEKVKKKKKGKGINIIIYVSTCNKTPDICIYIMNVQMLKKFTSYIY